MRAKTGIINVVKIKSYRTHLEYFCPHCKGNFKEHGFYDDRVTRFLCMNCNKEIIADYKTKIMEGEG